MAAKFRFVRNHRGIGQVLNGPEAVAALRARAYRAMAAAGPGHRVVAGPGRNRARAEVQTASRAAWQAELRHRNLTKALDAARGG